MKRMKSKGEFDDRKTSGAYGDGNGREGGSNDVRNGNGGDAEGNGDGNCGIEGNDSGDDGNIDEGNRNGDSGICGNEIMEVVVREVDLELELELELVILEVESMERNLWIWKVGDG